MKSVNDRIDFANILLAAGHYKGVINLTFGAFLYSPDPADVEVTEKTKVVADTAITARLRMDIECARVLHLALGNVLAGLSNPVPPPPPSPPKGGIVPEQEPEEVKGAVH
jgi:hypothetical protein